MISFIAKTSVFGFIICLFSMFTFGSSSAKSVGEGFQRSHYKKKTRKKNKRSIVNQQKPTVYCWGDSFTSSDYPVPFAQFTGYHMVDKGIGGETSTQIKLRMLGDPESHKFASIIWAGRNNYQDTATVIKDIKEMVNALKDVGNNKYLVIGIVNGNFAPEFKGGELYNIIIGLNKKLSKIFGNHFVDIRPVLVGLYNPGSQQDILDHDHDVPPTSKRIDPLHPTLSADSAIANYFIKSIGILNN